VEAAALQPGERVLDVGCGRGATLLPAAVASDPWAGAGFEVTHEDQVQVEFHFADPQGWWDWGWSNGMRAFYEILPADALEALRQDAFAELDARRTPAGIPLQQEVLVVVGAKPSTA
jgi:hypothetical protein